MKKYQPIPLPKHWLTSKMDKKPFEFSNESVIGIILGPLSLIYLKPWLALVLAFIDVLAIVIIHFIISHSFYSFILMVVSIVLLISNHYLSAWIRMWLVERGR